MHGTFEEAQQAIAAAVKKATAIGTQTTTVWPWRVWKSSGYAIYPNIRGEPE